MAIFYKLPGRARKSVEDEDFWRAKTLTAGLDTDDLDQDSFAAYCYEVNAVDELLAMLDGKPDPDDLAWFGLTDEEWRKELLFGLAALVREIEERAEGDV